MDYDVVVIGGGHAGIEASLASAKMGSKTLLITILVEQIGHLAVTLLLETRKVI